MTTPGRDPDRVIAELVAAFGKIPLEFRKDVGPQLKQAADPILAEAKSLASWSQRIPDAIRASARLSKRTQGVALVVDRKRAPHARAYEGLGTSGDTFRHRVYGQDTWAEEQKRPFLMPPVAQHRDEVFDAVGKAIEESARKHGWR